MHDQDIATGLNLALKKDGGNTATADIPMGGNKFTNVGDAAARTQFSTLKQVQDGGGVYVSTVGGTANAITLTTGFTVSAYTAGQKFAFKVATTNTGAVTVAVDSLAATAIKRADGTTALVAGDLVAGALVEIRYDGTNFQLSGNVNGSVSSDILARILPVGAQIWWGLPTIPAGWLKLTGTFASPQAVTKATYPELDAKYFADGYPYGSSSGTLGVGTMNLPPAAGRFVRVVDEGGAIDPDAASRTNRGDGTTGAIVGTLQADAFKSHHHSTPLGSNTTITSGSGSVPQTGSGVTGDTGGNETRPVNIYQYLIILANPAAAASASIGLFGLPYTFSATTTDADPGGGHLRLNNATLSSVTAAYIDDADANGADVSTHILTWDDSTNTALRGTIKISKVGAPSNIAIYSITGASTDAVGYTKLALTYVTHNGSFAEGDGISIEFSRTGNIGATGATGTGITWLGPWSAGTYVVHDAVQNIGSSWVAKGTTTEEPIAASANWDLLAAKGDTGAAGSNGTNGTSAGVKWNFDSTTAMADPGTGDVRLNNATLASVTAAAISDLCGETGNPDASPWVLAWDDSTNTVRGYVIFKKVSAPQNFAIYSISGASTDNVGWTQLALTHITSSGSFTNTDPLTVEFNRAGDKGADGAGTGDVTAAAAFAVDNVVIRSDGTGKGVQATGITVDDTTNAIHPSTNDVGILGVAATGEWSDLFLASGGVINWANGNATLTHSTGLLTSNVPIDLGTSNALKCGTVELGHATDTTIARSAAGKITVEGVAVRLAGRETIWVPAKAMTSRTTNGPSSGSVEMSTNKNMFTTLDFDTTTQEFAQFSIKMPKSWDLGTVAFVPVWSHAATTTNFGVAFGLAGIAISDNEAGDVAFGTAQTSVDTGGTTNNIYHGPESSAITIAGTPAALDYVMFQINRTVADAGDTMAIDARLHGVHLYYSTNAANDT